MSANACPACGAEIPPGEQTCAGCGRPLPLDLDASDVPCAVCGEPIAPMAQACPGCGESGYPALRPRRGKGWRGPEATEAPSGDRHAAALRERVIVVLHEPQDLVNVALVIRAMKNMGLARLRLVRPVEFDPYRIEGIAHGTEDVVESAELLPDLDVALADAGVVVGTTVRRRASRQQWWGPDDGAAEVLARAERAPVALLFGREDRGLSNEDLDRCHALITIPTAPDHPSLNLAHAALLVFWELRKRAAGAEPDTEGLSHKRRRTSPPATAEELEAFFEAWEAAMYRVGFFHHIDPLPKMRSFRSIFQRAELDRRELGLLQAAAYEVLHYARREAIRVREAIFGEEAIGAREGTGADPQPGGTEEDESS